MVGVITEGSVVKYQAKGSDHSVNDAAFVVADGACTPWTIQVAMLAFNEL